MQQKQIVDGARIKSLLESETRDSYILKRASELVRQDGTSWFVHLPIGEGMGWVDHAFEKQGVITLETAVIFDVRRRLEYDYPEQLGKKRLERSIPYLGDKNVRRKFSKQVPAIVAFFEEVDHALADVNKEYSISAEIVNDSSGMVSVKAEIRNVIDVLGSVRINTRALIEFDRRISRWLKEEYENIVNVRD